jgi:hypothetical protein
LGGEVTNPFTQTRLETILNRVDWFFRTLVESAKASFELPDWFGNDVERYKRLKRIHILNSFRREKLDFDLNQQAQNVSAAMQKQKSQKNDTRPKKLKRGRPTDYDWQDERRILRDYRTSELTVGEFAHERGYDQLELSRLLDRARKRENGERARKK